MTGSSIGSRIWPARGGPGGDFSRRRLRRSPPGLAAKLSVVYFCFLGEVSDDGGTADDIVARLRSDGRPA